MCIRDSYIGGIFGTLNYGEIQNIEANNINIEIDASYIGGIIGRMTVSYTHLDVYKRQILTNTIA